MALIATASCIMFSYWYSRYANHSDFPIFYNAASYLLHEDSRVSDIYDVWISLKYPLPEETNPGKFIYSPVALFLLAPLGYFEYYTAKTILMSIDMLCYIFSVYLILRYLDFSGRWFLYPFSLSLIWTPFFIDVVFVQINSILLLLLTLAICSIRNDKPLISGSLIGLAALFKIFPIGIAMLFGLRNWRVFASCLLVFVLALTIPGSFKWFAATRSINPISISPAYQFLGSISLSLFCLYSAIIGFVTALLIYVSKSDDYVKIASYSILAIFLAAPVFEYYHLTLLILPYLFLVKYLRTNFRIIYLFIFLISSSVICLGYFFGRLQLMEMQHIYYASMLLLWSTYTYIFISDHGHDREPIHVLAYRFR